MSAGSSRSEAGVRGWEGLAGRRGHSWQLEIMLWGWTALVLSPHKADWQRILDLSWGPAREEDGKETKANILQSDAA